MDESKPHESFYQDKSTPETVGKKKMLVQTSIDGGETWDTVGEYDETEAAQKMREIAHSGADQAGVEYRSVAK